MSDREKGSASEPQAAPGSQVIEIPEGARSRSRPARMGLWSRPSCYAVSSGSSRR